MGSTRTSRERYVSETDITASEDYTRDALLHMLDSNQGGSFPPAGWRERGPAALDVAAKGGSRLPLARRGERLSPLERGLAKKPGDAPPAEWDGTGRRVRPHSYHASTFKEKNVPSGALPPVHALAKRLKPLSGHPHLSNDAAYSDWVTAQKSGQRRFKEFRLELRTRSEVLNAGKGQASSPTGAFARPTREGSELESPPVPSPSLPGRNVPKDLVMQRRNSPGPDADADDSPRGNETSSPMARNPLDRVFTESKKPGQPSRRARIQACATLSPIQGYLAHKKHPPVRPHSSPMPRDLWWSQEGGLFLVSEVPLYPDCSTLNPQRST
jgi:hypothetical protein